MEDILPILILLAGILASVVFGIYVAVSGFAKWVKSKRSPAVAEPAAVAVPLAARSYNIDGLLLSLLFLGGIVAAYVWFSQKVAAPIAAAAEDLKQKLTPPAPSQSQINAAIASKSVVLGMPEHDVIASIGQPDRKNDTVTQFGKSSQWVYSRADLYLYLSDGRVTSWQKTTK